jgi:hypothetical protein
MLEPSIIFPFDIVAEMSLNDVKVHLYNLMASHQGTWKVCLGSRNPYTYQTVYLLQSNQGSGSPPAYACNSVGLGSTPDERDASPFGKNKRVKVLLSFQRELQHAISVWQQAVMRP